MIYKFNTEHLDCQFNRTDNITRFICFRLHVSLIGQGTLYQRDHNNIVASNSFIGLSGNEGYTCTNLPGTEDGRRGTTVYRTFESDEVFANRLDVFEKFAKQYGWGKVRRNHFPGWF